MASEVLVTFRHASGTAAVVRDGDVICLSGYLGEDETVVDVVSQAMSGLLHDQSAEGGLLPSGAVGAEVVDRAGRRHRAAAANGAWVIVLDEPTHGDPRPVRFIDAEGATVRRPLPTDWTRTPLPHHHLACPACGARDWQRVIPSDGSFGMVWVGKEPPRAEPPLRVPDVGGDWAPTPHVACTTCGHYEPESSGVLMWTDQVEADT